MRKISLQKNYFSISALITPRLSNWCWLSYYRCLKIFSLTALPSSSTSFPSYCKERKMYMYISSRSILVFHIHFINRIPPCWYFRFFSHLLCLLLFILPNCVMCLEMTKWKESFVWNKVRCLWHFWSHQIENFCCFLLVLIFFCLFEEKCRGMRERWNFVEWIFLFLLIILAVIIVCRKC